MTAVLTFKSDIGPHLISSDGNDGLVGLVCMVAGKEPCVICMVIRIGDLS